MVLKEKKKWTLMVKDREMTTVLVVVVVLEMLFWCERIEKKVILWSRMEKNEKKKNERVDREFSKNESLLALRYLEILCRYLLFNMELYESQFMGGILYIKFGQLVVLLLIIIIIIYKKK